MPYVLCMKRGQKHATLHRTDCPHYIHRRRDESANVEWTSSPHQNIADAISEARDRGKAEIPYPCKDCISSEEEDALVRLVSKAR